MCIMSLLVALQSMLSYKKKIKLNFLGDKVSLSLFVALTPKIGEHR